MQFDIFVNISQDRFSVLNSNHRCLVCSGPQMTAFLQVFKNTQILGINQGELNKYHVSPLTPHYRRRLRKVQNPFKDGLLINIMLGLLDNESIEKDRAVSFCLCGVVFPLFISIRLKSIQAKTMHFG